MSGLSGYRLMGGSRSTIKTAFPRMRAVIKIDTVSKGSKCDPLARSTRMMETTCRVTKKKIVGGSTARNSSLTFSSALCIGFPILLGEHELHLRTNLPVRSEVRPRDVVVRGELRVHRQFSEVEDLADTAAQRDRPPLTAARLPVDRPDRGAGQIEAIRKVVIDEGLNEPVVVRATLLVAGQRPDVVNERAVNPRVTVLQMQHNRGRAEAPVLVAELLAAVGRKLRDRPDAPDPFARVSRREESGQLHVADAALGAHARVERRHPYHRQDRPRDDIPVLVDRDWDHRLDIEDVLRSPFRAEVEVRVVWNGRLIRLPTGFCASFASSSALRSACALIATSMAAPSTVAEMHRLARSFGIGRGRFRQLNVVDRRTGARLELQQRSIRQVPSHVISLPGALDRVQLVLPLLLRSLSGGIL